MTGAEFDKAKAEPDVIDNREAAMADVLNINMGRIDFLDISSGYFEVNGYGLVRKTLEAAATDPSFAFRLMVGKDAIRPPAFDTFEEYRRYAEMRQASMKSDLDGKEIDGASMDDVMGLVGFLKQDNVQVRRGRARFNHAKCYILGNEGAVVGSSNFTRAGLSGNDELNAGVYNTATWAKIRGWYERMWDGAEDAKHDMLRVLEQSKFGVPAEPYDIYLKILFEKYKRILTEMAKSDTTATKALAKFQRDAVSTILQIIDERGGAMLADSTGLGKTHIGLEVMRQKMPKGKKVLLIAPAQVRDTVWKDKLEEAQISAKTIGMEELGRKDFDVFKFKKYDFVVIDESQNFRSSATGRRHNLMKIMSLGKRKQVLLMSATPINNSLMDLYYQISIITGGRNDHFADIGIPDLYGYLRKAANHRLNDGLEKVQLLLDTIMVRRTRTFIREVYPNEEISGKPITFPKRDYEPIRYGMTDLFGNVYEDLFKTIKSLHMAPYGIEKYNTTLTDEEKQKHAVLAHLQVILLLKRFESSVVAVTISIENKIALFEYFGSVLKRNRIVSPKQLNRIMMKWNAQSMEGEGDDDELRDRFFMDEIRNLPVQDAGKYDVRLMRRDVESDLAHLRRYRDSLKKMPKFDKKAEAVADMILKDGALDKEGRKVLVFTEYTATATYIKQFLEDKFDGKRVELITGSVKKKRRPDIIREFSPKANVGEDDEMPKEETDILVSTEVLSEGQNLQDCNYVVNYDLPWNPMRIVQRIGRVDRLTSMHDTVHSRECFPDEKLDELLMLVGKLMDKIGDINDAVGLDADLLGQEATPKNFGEATAGRIRALAGGDGAGRVIGELERESDLMPTRSPINEISQHIKRAGIMKMEEFSMGRRSGKPGEGRKAVLAYLRKTPTRRFHSVVFDHATGRAEVVDDMEAIMLAKCSEDTPTYLPMDGDGHTESFEQLLGIDRAAREAIKTRNSSDHQISHDLQARPKKSEKTIEKIRGVIDDEVGRGNLPLAEGEAVDKILDSAGLLQWDDDMESLLDDYDARRNIRSLVGQLRRIGDNIGVNADKPSGEAEEKPGRLVLVGAVFITGDGQDAGRTGMDRFA